MIAASTYTLPDWCLRFFARHTNDLMDRDFKDPAFIAEFDAWRDAGGYEEFCARISHEQHA